MRRGLQLLCHIWLAAGGFSAICWLDVGVATLMVQLPRFIDLDSAAFAAQSKSADDIIKSAKFPSAYAPGPDYPAMIETDCWSLPISHAALGTVGTTTLPSRFKADLLTYR